MRLNRDLGFVSFYCLKSGAKRDLCGCLNYLLVPTSCFGKVTGVVRYSYHHHKKTNTPTYFGMDFSPRVSLSDQNLAGLPARVIHEFSK